MGMSLELEIKWATDHVAKLAAEAKRLEKEVAALKIPWGTFVEYEPLKYDSIGGIPTDPIDWARFERTIKEDRERDARNQPKIAANNALLSRLVATIKATGIKSESWHYKSARTMKREAVTAEWLVLLRNAMPKLPGSLDRMEELHKRNLDRREEHARHKEAAQREAERQVAEQEESRKKLARIVAVASALGLPVTVDEEEIRDELRKRDKYIDLAIAGMQTRSDWTDGCYRVNDALARFDAVTPDDKAIAREWQEICNDFEDGRSFRDATWNYERVIQLADSKLLALYATLEGSSS